jgi:hypothetical protein
MQVERCEIQERHDPVSGSIEDPEAAVDRITIYIQIEGVSEKQCKELRHGIFILLSEMEGIYGGSGG